MIYTIYSYGGGDYLANIFNGIASLFGNQGFYKGLQAAALVGFSIWLFSAAFKQSKISFQWFITLSLTIMFLVTSKTSIHIEDKLHASNSVKIDNIPLGLALPASLISIASNALVEKFEVAFSLPHQIKYSGNGMLFAQSILEEAQDFELQDSRNSVNLSDFWQNCVYYDIALGLYSWDSIVKSNNISNFLKSNVSKSRFFTYRGKNGNNKIIECRGGFNNKLLKDVEEEVARLKNIYASYFFKNDDRVNDVVDRFAGVMKVGYGYFSSLSVQASDAIMQNVMANSFKNGISSFATKSDAIGAIQEYATVKAERSRNASYQATSKISKKMMPVLQHNLEALVYALFPFACLMILVASFKFFKFYAQVLLWINLWPFLYAILNYSISFYARKSTLAYLKFTDYQDGLNMVSSAKIAKILSEYSTNAGILSLSVPVIAWIIVSQSGHMVSMLAERVLGGYEGPAQRAAEEASDGNMSMGQFNYQNQSAFQHNSAPTSRSGFSQDVSESGTNVTTTASGRYISTQSSSVPVDINFASMAMTGARKALSDAESFHSTASSDFTRSIQAMNSQRNEMMESINSHKSYTEGDSIRKSKIDSISSENVERWTKSFAKNNNWSTSKAIGALTSAEATAGGGVDLGVFKAGGHLRTAATRSTSDTDVEMEQKMVQAMNSESFASALRADLGAMKDFVVNNGVSVSDQKMQNFSNSISNSESSSLRYTKSKNNLKNSLESYEKAKNFSSTINEKGIDRFLSWAEEHRGLSSEEMSNLFNNYNQNKVWAIQELSNLSSDFVDSSLFNRSDLGKIDFNRLGSIEGDFENNSNRIKDLYDNQDKYFIDKEKLEKERLILEKEEEANERYDNMPKKDSDRFFADQDPDLRFSDERLRYKVNLVKNSGKLYENRKH